MFTFAFSATRFIGSKLTQTQVCECVCVSAVAARFSCENSKVSVGERNVRLKCEVRAQPRLTALYWIIDDNGTTVHEGEVVDRYWTLSLILVRQYSRLLCVHSHNTSLKLVNGHVYYPVGLSTILTYK